jgi:hypothetical protein
MGTVRVISDIVRVIGTSVCQLGSTTPSLAMKIIIALITLVHLFSITVIAQGQSAVPTEQTQLAKIERENLYLKDDIAKLKEDISRIKQAQAEDNARLKDHQKELADRVKEIEPFAKYWILFLGAILGLSTFWGLWAYFKTIPSFVKKEYESRIGAMFQDRRNDLLEVLKDYDTDQEIKKKFRIILLTHREGTDDYHYEQLTKHGFRVYPYTRVEALASALAADDITSNDVIVINNEGKHWLPADVRQLVHDNPHCCFYIGRDPIELEGNAINRFAAANFRAQFIGNLMNILRYRN